MLLPLSEDAAEQRTQTRERTRNGLSPLGHGETYVRTYVRVYTCAHKCAYERITTQAQNNVAPTKINHRDRYAIIWLWLEMKCRHPYIRKYIRTKAATATTQSEKDMMLSMAGACGWLMLVVGLAACIHGSKQNGTHVVTSYM